MLIALIFSLTKAIDMKSQYIPTYNAPDLPKSEAVNRSMTKSAYQSLMRKPLSVLARSVDDNPQTAHAAVLGYN
jgi:hypothetical protein